MYHSAEQIKAFETPETKLFRKKHETPEIVMMHISNFDTHGCELSASQYEGSNECKIIHMEAYTSIIVFWERNGVIRETTISSNHPDFGF